MIQIPAVGEVRARVGVKEAKERGEAVASRGEPAPDAVIAKIARLLFDAKPGSTSIDFCVRPEHMADVLPRLDGYTVTQSQGPGGVVLNISWATK